MKRKPTKSDVDRVWEEIEGFEPDISTERLIAMSQDRLRMEGFSVDFDEFITLLVQGLKPVEQGGVILRKGRKK